MKIIKIITTMAIIIISTLNASYQKNVCNHNMDQLDSMMRTFSTGDDALSYKALIKAEGYLNNIQIYCESNWIKNDYYKRFQVVIKRWNKHIKPISTPGNVTGAWGF